MSAHLRLVVPARAGTAARAIVLAADSSVLVAPWQLPYCPRGCSLGLCYEAFHMTMGGDRS
jgi:hypothetical protein